MQRPSRLFLRFQIRTWMALAMASGLVLLAFQNCGRISVVDRQLSSLVSPLAQTPQPSASVSFVVVSNGDVMNGVSAERVIPAGESVYIRWTLAREASMTGVPVVKIAYTLDDNGQSVVADGLIDGSNGGCQVNGPGSADDSATGCYVWQNGSPSSSYYKIRVSVSGVGSSSIVGESLPINASGIQFLAGATGNSLGNSAKNSILMDDMASTVFQPDVQSLAISTRGVLYFRDVNLGLVYFSAQDMTLRRLLPLGAKTSSEGDGGPVTKAALRWPVSLASDYQGGLLIFDQDRIRRVDFSTDPATISTIVGGGTDLNATDPLKLKIDNSFYSPTRINLGDFRFPLKVLPNGDFYFFNRGFNIYQHKPILVYHAATKTISQINPSGDLNLSEGTVAAAVCAVSSFDIEFNPQSSAISKFVVTTSTYDKCGTASNVWFFHSYEIDPATGLVKGLVPDFPEGASTAAMSVEAHDGKIYRTVRNTIARIRRFDSSSGTWVNMVGSGTIGTCPEGTQADLCDFEPSGSFVDPTGAVVFSDRGRIRSVVNSKVITLAGQAYSFGDGGAAINSRFGLVTAVQPRNDGGLVLLDMIEGRFRQFSRGGVIFTIAGNGKVSDPDTSKAASSQGMTTNWGWEQFRNFAIDPASNDILYVKGPFRQARLIDKTNLWTVIGGGGDSPYSQSSTGTLATNLNFYGATGLVGFDGFNPSYFTYTFDGVKTKDILAFSIDHKSGAYSPIFGPVSPYTGAFCKDGTSVESCQSPMLNRTESQAMGAYDAIRSSWYFLDSDAQTVRSLPLGGKAGTLVKLVHPASAFLYRRFNKSEFIYYCPSDTGILMRVNLANGVETQLPWSIPTMSCAGSAFFYEPNNHSLVFVFRQNGLNGVAELFSVDPPASEQK